VQDRNKTYLLYDGVGDSTDSNNTNAFAMSNNMRNMGFTKVYYMTDSVSAWRAAGYPTDIIP
jgi:3-mercaptopyruvate sulfurtransferase SseA